MTAHRATAVIESILGDPHTADRVARYFTGRRFAGSLFDTLGDNPRDCFTTDDLLAVSTLSVKFEPPALRALLFDNGLLASLLNAIPDDVPLWEATDNALDLGEELWGRLRDIDGVGPTKTSKLMARKRPWMFPVLDRVVRARLEISATTDNAWHVLRASVREVGVDRIEAIRPDGLDPKVTTLRLLDVAIWMDSTGK